MRTPRGLVALALLAGCGGTTTPSATDAAADAPSVDTASVDVTTVDAGANAPADVVVLDTTVATDAQPFACGAMTCGAAQYCVHTCSGGADAGGGGAPAFCVDAPTACDRHACSCFDGLCGSQPYACGYNDRGRDVTCMCA